MKQILGNFLPTIKISIIKYDGGGSPVISKYKIVALGSLDPHDWTV
jgi:hypothetical protein